MNVLPPPLAPWHDLLAGMSPDAVAVLGPMIARLAPAVGPLRARVSSEGAAPDGFDGLARRGSYERLLLTEWLLADAAPEEFVRRAATGELSFHRVARREAATPRTSVALFDAGPTQLGAPRIVHVALLLVLARRASEARASFAWGVLQAPPAEGRAALRTDVSPVALDALLAARDATRPGDHDLCAWRDFEARSVRWDDVWIVGDRDVAARWRALRRDATSTGGGVAVEDVLEPDARRVMAHVTHRSVTRPVSLELPPDATCARLLRGPVGWGAEAPKPAPRGRRGRYLRASAPTSSLLLSPEGHRLAWRAAGGTLMVCAVPTTPRDGYAKLARHPLALGEVALAAGWLGRRLVVATVRDAQLLVYEWSGGSFPRASARRPAPPGLVARASSFPLSALHLHHAREHGAGLSASLLVDWTVYQLDPDGAKALGPDGQVVAAVAWRLTLHRAVDPDDARAQLPPFAVAVRGESVPGLDAARGEVAFASLLERGWVRHDAPEGAVTTDPDGHLVLGFHWQAHASGAPSLVAQVGPRDFACVRAAERVPLHQAHEEVRSAAVNLGGTRLAYVTRDDVVVVRDLVRGLELVRLTPEDA